MKPVVLAMLAQLDLKDIADKGLESWGVVRSQRYIADITTVLEGIGMHPGRHPRFGSDRPELRRVKSGRHILFYREHEDVVAVLRILHESMDHERYLPKAGR